MKTEETLKVNWEYGESINPQLIHAFSISQHICFPESYIALVTKFNYAYPNPDVLSISEHKMSVKCLLSFKRDDLENIYDFTDAVQERNPGVIPFALDNFGNSFVFEVPTMKIGFYNHEQNETLWIAESFDLFLRLLGDDQIS